MTPLRFEAFDQLASPLLGGIGLHGMVPLQIRYFYILHHRASICLLELKSHGKLERYRELVSRGLNLPNQLEYIQIAYQSYRQRVYSEKECLFDSDNGVVIR